VYSWYYEVPIQQDVVLNIIITIKSNILYYIKKKIGSIFDYYKCSFETTEG
jgi:hypothetical protein